jgi:hypothetical protein
MAYIIKTSDNSTVLLTLADNEVDDSTTSLTLIGKNVNNYGEYYNTNLVWLLTNFASPNNFQPRNPLEGQLWFNTTTKRLSVYDGSSFKPTYGATISSTEPLTTSTGDLWYDTINTQLKIWSGIDYKIVAPATSGLYGKFGVEPIFSIENYNTGQPAEVSSIYSYGTGVGFITTSGFTLSPTDASLYLGPEVTQQTVIHPGTTILGNIDIYGDIHIRGDKQIAPNKTLSMYYPGTDPNNDSAIIPVLTKMFPLETNASINQVGYAVGSEARIILANNIVLRYRVIDVGNGPTWDPYDIYNETNIVP